MNTRYQGLPEGEDRIVYVRPVAVADLPDEIRAEAEGFGLATLYSVHRPDGERVALVGDRGQAFLLSRQHDLTPVNAH